MKALGKSIVWFDHPVEIDKAPDYYSIIHNPMDLGTIQDRLETRQYTSPQQFFEVRVLHWLLVPRHWLFPGCTSASAAPDGTCPAEHTSEAHPHVGEEQTLRHSSIHKTWP